MATIVADKAKPRRKQPRERLPETPDPVEIAMVAAASGKPIPDVARKVLEAQAQLIGAQCAELRFRRVGEIVRAVLWGILATAAFALLALAAAIVVRAMRSEALVVESFRVPPAMAAQGLTGEVVATQVLDKLAEMQANSESTRAASSYANNWGDELKIDIPQTGASVDQVWKLMRGWLGNETRISGEVISAGGGLALTARVGSSPGQRFADPKAGLDGLVVQAAELIYRETQPYRYAIYAGREPGRRAERHALLKRLTADPSELERKWAYNGLSVDYREAGDFGRSAAMARKALSIDPDMIPALGNLSAIEFLEGRDQLAVDRIRRQHRLPVGDGYDAAIVQSNNCRTRNQIAYVTRNIDDALWSLQCFEQATGLAGGSRATTQATLALLRHDLPRALAVRIASTSPGYTQDEVELDNATMALLATVQDAPPPAVAAALRRFEAALQRALQPSLITSAYNRATIPTRVWPLQAEALLRLGRTQQAAALIARTPADCYTCVRVRGLAAQAQGDAPGAQRWFLEAIRQAPRLAPAYVDLGRLYSTAGRIGPAEARLREAQRLAPNWPDPLKYHGDVLAARGQREQALEKYDLALKFAPNWTALRDARARVGGR